MRRAPAISFQVSLLGFFAIVALFLLALNSEALFPTAQYEPHALCFVWDRTLLWLFIGSDTFIGLSYVSISLALMYVVSKVYLHIPYHWMIIAFGTFIFACGITHFMDVWTLWYPDYWLSGGVRVITALASVVTAFAMPPLVPRLLRLVADARTSQQHKASLIATVAKLEQEILSRKHAEDEVRRLNAELEQRVSERTAQLEAANREKDALLLSEQDLRLRAEEASHLKNTFLGIISHELRTPLTVIKGFTSTLISPEADWDPASQHEFLTIVDSEADKLATLVEDMLEMSRIQAGVMAVTLEQYTVAEIIASSRPQLEMLSRNHHFSLEMAEPLPPVIADLQRVGQVLANLVANAARYSPEGTPIMVTAHRIISSTAPMVQFNVRDEGIGIPADQRLFVFDAFKRIGAMAGRREGVGLGLTIAKGIIEKHNGHIWISDNDGPGITVSFTLPVTPAHT